MKLPLRKIMEKKRVLPILKLQKTNKSIWIRPQLTLERATTKSNNSSHTSSSSITLRAKSRAIKQRASTQMDGQEISIIHLERSCVTWLAFHIMTTSTEIRVSTIRSNKNIKLNSASIILRLASVHSHNTANSLMAKKN